MSDERGVRVEMGKREWAWNPAIPVTCYTVATKQSGALASQCVHAPRPHRRCCHVSGEAFVALWLCVVTGDKKKFHIERAGTGLPTGREAAAAGGRVWAAAGPSVRLGKKEQKRKGKSFHFLDSTKLRGCLVL